jgi:hypothetical protein
LMPVEPCRRKPIVKRGQLGSQLAEFAPALIVLVLAVFLPLVDLVVVPIRWMLAQNLANDYARRLALCETFSQAQRLMNADPSLSARLENLGGVTLRSVDLKLKITRIRKVAGAQDVFMVEAPGRIPPQWLPDGANAPLSYSLELRIDSLLSPAILFAAVGQPVPGLSAPIPLSIVSSHTWENLGRDPRSRKFFLDE